MREKWKRWRKGSKKGSILPAGGGSSSWKVSFDFSFDESGNQVGKPVNTLASQEFTITELNNDGSYQGKFDKQLRFNINIFQRFLPQTCLNFCDSLHHILRIWTCWTKTNEQSTCLGHPKRLAWTLLDSYPVATYWFLFALEYGSATNTRKAF